MYPLFRPSKSFSREIINRNFKFESPIQPVLWHSHRHIPPKIFYIYKFCTEITTTFDHHTRKSETCFPGSIEAARFVRLIPDSDKISGLDKHPDDQFAIKIQDILKSYKDSSIEHIERDLDQCKLTLTDNLVMNILKRNSSDWKLAYIFFNWVSRKAGASEFLPGSGVYNEILDILGKMHCFEEVTQVLDKMSKRKGLANEATYGILLNRYAAAHKADEAMEVFRRRKDFGVDLDLAAFQRLLMCLCRYKHVKVAETLFHSKKFEFGFNIKTMNIILNGWCVLGNVREAKRFWKDIMASKCKPDLFTYGTFINALTKKGKLGSAMKLFRSMWDKGCNPDVAICNCVIDALCFKKRIPEALEVFRGMGERGCLPNVATYNSLIKHLCKNERMEKVYELVAEMEEKKGSCLPNDITFNYLLKSLKKPEEVPGILERMEKNGCKMTNDTYNLILKLHVAWNCEERVRVTWREMEERGLGPDRRSYTIMIHGLHVKGRLEEALCYFSEMRMKGFVQEPRTEILVNAMKEKLNESEAEEGKKVVVNSETTSRSRHRRERKTRAR